MKKKKEMVERQVREKINLMSTPLMSILPGQISFFVILSIIPLASIIMMLISKLSLNYDSIANFINHYLPGGVAPVVLAIFEQQKAGVVDVVFIVTAFYLAAKATHSIIVASTQIYNGMQRDFVRTRIKAIIMLIILVILALVVVGVLTVGSRIINYIILVNGSINEILFWTYKILRWPFVIFMIFITVKVIYTIAPNVDIPSKSVNKGALFTTIVWGISTYAYSIYVTNFANYTRFYGNLSNIIILMIWIYWLCYIFVFGMTMNEYRLTNKKSVKS